MSLIIEKTHPEVGARVRGVDLSKPVDAATAAAIRKAFDDHIVLIFPDQALDEAQHLRAAEIFGRVAWRKKPVSGPGPGGDFDTPFMLVTNIVENGKPIGAFGDGEMWFHHDTSYYPEPHRATLLYAMKLTSWGGETCFSNMYRAYEMIPSALRDRLEGRRVLQMHDYKRRERLNLDTTDLSKIRHNWQPLFVRHPATGRKALYISRLMSSQIEGLSREESEDVLERLFDLSEDPRIVYEHNWSVGDLVIWDNWCSIHARKDFPREEPRLMRRLTIEGQALGF
jgi:taurine dioxygenase